MINKANRHEIRGEGSSRRRVRAGRSNWLRDLVHDTIPLAVATAGIVLERGTAVGFRQNAKNGSGRPARETEGRVESTWCEKE